MSRYKRMSTKWKHIPGYLRKNSHKNKNSPRGRSRRREATKNIFKTPVIKRFNPLSPIKKSVSTPQTSRSSQVSYPTLPRGIFSENGSASVTQRSSAPGKLSNYTVPEVDLPNDDSFSYPSTPTPSSRRPHSKSWTSGGSPYITFKDPIAEADIDGKIYRMLIKGPNKVNPLSPLGYVYCGFRIETPECIKIGSTADPIERIKQISRNGRFGTLTHRASSLCTHFKLAERLIHLELWNQRKESKFQDMLSGDTYKRSERETISSSPKQATEPGKTEWFHIERGHANEVCDKWVTWLRKSNPYDQSGELNEFWRSWFTQQIERNPYCKATHSSLHLRWNALLNPTRYEVCCHYLSPIADQCYAWAKKNPRATLGIILSCVCLSLFYLHHEFMATGLIIATTIILSHNNNEMETKRR